jgi:hypothetical protein
VTQPALIGNIEASKRLGCLKVRKADVIAKCLVQSALASDMKAALEAVRSAYEKTRKDKSFSKWNTVVEQNVANSIIRSVGNSKAISIEKFITDLS